MLFFFWIRNQRDFLDIVYLTNLPECELIDFFCYGLNKPLQDKLVCDSPPGSFAEFLDYALLLVGSPFKLPRSFTCYRFQHALH